MINPTKEDIGRGVVYRPQFGEPEDGAITSFNDKFVFVRYQKQHPSQPGQATLREDLEWLSGSDRIGFCCHYKGGANEEND